MYKSYFLIIFCVPTTQYYVYKHLVELECCTGNKDKYDFNHRIDVFSLCFTNEYIFDYDVLNNIIAPHSRTILCVYVMLCVQNTLVSCCSGIDSLPGNQSPASVLAGTARQVGRCFIVIQNFIYASLKICFCHKFLK